MCSHAIFHRRQWKDETAEIETKKKQSERERERGKEWKDETDRDRNKNREGQQKKKKGGYGGIAPDVKKTAKEHSNMYNLLKGRTPVQQPKSLSPWPIVKNAPLNTLRDHKVLAKYIKEGGTEWNHAWIYRMQVLLGILRRNFYRRMMQWIVRRDKENTIVQLVWHNLEEEEGRLMRRALDADLGLAVLDVTQEARMRTKSVLDELALRGAHYDLVDSEFRQALPKRSWFDSEGSREAEVRVITTELDKKREMMHKVFEMFARVVASRTEQESFSGQEELERTQRGEWYRAAHDEIGRYYYYSDPDPKDPAKKTKPTWQVPWSFDPF